MFASIRNLIVLVIMVFVFVCLRKVKKRKWLWGTITVIASIGLLIYLGTVPFENGMVRFDSAEKAFRYQHGPVEGRIVKVEGMNTALFFQLEEEKTSRTMLFVKDAKGWKLPDSRTAQEYIYFDSPHSTVTVQKSREHEECLVSITTENFGKAYDLDIQDSLSSYFSPVTDEDTGRVRAYYAILERLPEDYRLVINSQLVVNGIDTSKAKIIVGIWG